MSWLKKRAAEAAKYLVDGWDRGSSSRTEIAELVEAVAREFAERVNDAYVIETGRRSPGNDHLPAKACKCKHCAERYARIVADADNGDA